ncbi:glycoside hydrolase family 43 protein [Konateibacter massiliensis]|uniref:glycoside hydrolase family 43 protein n=1 Tax=Konateibacter massiliensis TaxID=2002841 RepID=UPI000C14E128|nr:glycoside hydrolase family 43 protein [Konateibacter massiliensis]
MGELKHLRYNEPWILQRADPYVIKHTDGYYYFTATVPEYDRIIIRYAKALAELTNAKEYTVWMKHKTGVMGSHIWAPELHFFNGKWYIYFAAGDVEDVWKIRPYVLECEDKNPATGEWKELGMMQIAEDDLVSFTNFSLDATVFEHKGEHYFVWAQKVEEEHTPSNLYIAKMETPWKLKTKGALLTTPDYDWERVGFWVNEGPFVIKRGNKIFLTFSASATGACYCMGMLEADADADLLNPNSWFKYEEPVLTTDVSKGIYGPGHNCFTVDEDGKNIMVYHARMTEEIVGDPLNNPNRHAMIMKLEWNSDNKPVFQF